ncbi:hypothetical protein N7G274_010402 [Stereocaulon virgatum]|uniref:NADH-ubiquinone oxidoreductase 17.8 kDa subunit n=1 Tax=Stereocaulon virgatum TaxID=373712 RepID=A0ABR3ZWF9_9LECA
MLQTKRVALRLAQRPLVCQRRGYADPSKPPDPMTTERSVTGKGHVEAMGGHDSSGTPSAHAASAGQHGPGHSANHPEPVEEHFGRGFYISIAGLALSFAYYKFSRSSSDPDHQPLLTRLIQSYSWWQDEFARRNTVHTAMVEQAAADRNLFQSSPWNHHIDLKFPEVFNTGSPYNVPAGHSINLEAVKAHYEKQNAELDRKRMERLKRQAGESELLAQREAEAKSKPKSILQSLGLAKPGE